MNGLVGVCILVGAIRHKEQVFQQTGVSAALATICALTVLTLILPNFTISEPGPVYAPFQLAFVAWFHSYYMPPSSLSSPSATATIPS